MGLFGKSEKELDEARLEKGNKMLVSWVVRKWKESQRRKAEEFSREQERRRKDTEESVRKALDEDEDDN